MHIIKYDVVDSTQLIAKKIAHIQSDLTVIVANDQTSGIGRYDRKWVSGVGGLWATWILKKEIPIEKLPFLALFTGYQLHQFFSKKNISVELKYPNDILYHRKKLSGILCNSSICGRKHIFSLIGIGLNISNKPPEEGISLNQISKETFLISELIIEITEIIKKARKQLINTDSKEIFTKLKEIKSLNLPLDNNLNLL